MVGGDGGGLLGTKHGRRGEEEEEEEEEDGKGSKRRIRISCTSERGTFVEIATDAAASPRTWSRNKDSFISIVHLAKRSGSETFPSITFCIVKVLVSQWSSD